MCNIINCAATAIYIVSIKDIAEPAVHMCRHAVLENNVFGKGCIMVSRSAGGTVDILICSGLRFVRYIDVCRAGTCCLPVIVESAVGAPSVHVRLDLADRQCCRVFTGNC